MFGGNDMKKGIKSIIVLIVGAVVLLCSVNVIGIKANLEVKESKLFEEWTGEIRIEGETQTTWKGTVSFSSSEIEAENMETHEIETHYIPYPSPLGAVDEASKQGSFSYTVVYYPSWDSLFVIEIGGDLNGEKTGWVYFVDYEIPMIGADKYELTGEDSGVLWGFLYFESWEAQAHALQVSTDKSTVKKYEEFTVTVTNETGAGVEGAIVYIDSMSFLTNEDGEVTTSLDTLGTYEIYAEKDPTPDDTYIRSDKISILVKKSRDKTFNLIERLPILDRLLQLFLLNIILKYR